MPPTRVSGCGRRLLLGGTSGRGSSRGGPATVQCRRPPGTGAQPARVAIPGGGRGAGLGGTHLGHAPSPAEAPSGAAGSPPPAAAAAPAASLPGLADRKADAVTREEGGEAVGWRSADAPAPRLRCGPEPAFRATGVGTGTLTTRSTRIRGQASWPLGLGKPWASVRE